MGPRAQPFGKQASPSTPSASSVDGAAASAAAASVVAAAAATAAKATAAAAAAAAAASAAKADSDRKEAAAAGASPPPAATTPSAASRAASPAPSAGGAPSRAEEAARSRAKALAVEFQSLGSLKEVDTTLAEIGIASASAAEGEEEASSSPALPEAEAAAATAALVDELFLTAYGLKGLDRGKFQELVAHVARASDGARAGIPRAVRLVLDTLEGEAEDAPFAPALVGEASAGFIAEGLLSFKEFAQTLLAAGVEDFEGEEEEEDAAAAGAEGGAEKVLMGSGTTSKVLAATLSALAKRKGADEAKAAWEATGLSLKSFLPKDDREIDALADDLAKDCGLN